MKISGSPPPMTPTAILIESGSVMRMAWQKMSINLSMSFLPAELKAWPQLNLRASRRETSKHGHERLRALMSAFGPKQTSLVAPHMSDFGGKADMDMKSIDGRCPSRFKIRHRLLAAPAPSANSVIEHRIGLAQS
jgi:hypothetical protein